MKVWTLTVDGHQELVTTVHASLDALMAALRSNYAEAEDVAEDDLVDHVVAQGNEVAIGVHDLPVGEQFVLVIGNPIDGLGFAGTFYSPEQASAYAEENLRVEWWVAGINPAGDDT